MNLTSFELWIDIYSGAARGHTCAIIYIRSYSNRVLSYGQFDKITLCPLLHDLKVYLFIMHDFSCISVSSWFNWPTWLKSGQTGYRSTILTAFVSQKIPENSKKLQKILKNTNKFQKIPKNSYIYDRFFFINCCTKNYNFWCVLKHLKKFNYEHP